MPVSPKPDTDDRITVPSALILAAARMAAGLIIADCEYARSVNTPRTNNFNPPYEREEAEFGGNHLK